MSFQLDNYSAPSLLVSDILSRRALNILEESTIFRRKGVSKHQPMTTKFNWPFYFQIVSKTRKYQVIKINLGFIILYAQFIALM